MKFRTFIIASAIMTAATGFAHAQSNPSKDPGEASVNGTSRATTPNDTSKMNQMKPSSATTGVKPSDAAKESNQKTESPASMNAGEKKEK